MEVFSGQSAGSGSAGIAVELGQSMRVVYIPRGDFWDKRRDVDGESPSNRREGERRQGVADHGVINAAQVRARKGVGCSGAGVCNKSIRHRSVKVNGGDNSRWRDNNPKRRCARIDNPAQLEPGVSFNHPARECRAVAAFRIPKNCQFLSAGAEAATTLLANKRGANIIIICIKFRVMGLTGHGDIFLNKIFLPAIRDGGGPVVRDVCTGVGSGIFKCHNPGGRGSSRGDAGVFI